MKKLDNKGQMNALQTFIMGVVGVCVVLVIGLIVINEVRPSICTDSTYPNYNETGNLCWNSHYNVSVSAGTGGTSATTLITKLATVPNWVGILIVVFLASLVLGYFYMKSRV